MRRSDSETSLLPLLAKLAFLGFALALLIELGAGFGTRLGVWRFATGYGKIFPWSLYAGLVALALALFWALAALIQNRGAGARYGVVALLGSIGVIYLPLYDLVMARITPPIHDISTDTEFPPQFKALLPVRARAETPAEYDGPSAVIVKGKHMTVSAAQKKYYSDLRGIAVLEKRDKMYWHAFFTVKKMGWTIIAFDPVAETIEATATSLLFGLTQDIAIRVRPAGLGARLDIRSKSRIGGADFGANAANIRAYVRKFAGQ